MANYYLYTLRSGSKLVFIGITINVSHDLCLHRSGKFKETRTFSSIQLQSIEKFDYYQDAVFKKQIMETELRLSGKV
jgi:predicted GIY-YIG superfamily endonuclease